jgi:hypothetical protein
VIDPLTGIIQRPAGSLVIIIRITRIIITLIIIVRRSLDSATFIRNLMFISTNIIAVVIRRHLPASRLLKTRNQTTTSSGRRFCGPWLNRDWCH